MVASTTFYQSTTLRVFTNDYSDLERPKGKALVYVTVYLLKKCLIRHLCDISEKICTNANTLLIEETIFEN